MLPTTPTKAGDVFQADVMRTIIDTVEFEIGFDGEDPFQAAREVAILAFGPAVVSCANDRPAATVSDVVANLRQRNLTNSGWRHVEGSFG